MNFTTTKNKAISLAKEILRKDFNVGRLPYTSIKSTSCRCNCGESLAVEVTACLKVKEDLHDWKSVTIGICKTCSNI